MAKAQTKKAQSSNGKIKRLSPERLAELLVPATAKTPEEKEAAFKYATEGPRFKTRVTRDMYRPG
jgi:purine nucleoside phosphorylase